MQHNLIIGGFSGYDINTIKPWVKSISKIWQWNVDKVAVVGDTNEETLTFLDHHGFNIVRMQTPEGMAVHVARFLHIYEYLRHHHHLYDKVVTTDVRDVIFQTDPFEWMDQNLGDKKIVTGSEELRYKDEPWGNQNLLQTYGPYVYEIFKDNEVFNVGVLGGKSEYIKDLVFNVVTNSVNRPIPVVDQAVFNVLIRTQPYKDCVMLAKHSDGWACQAGTTADPNKIDYFRSVLLDQEPILKDEEVYTPAGKKFCIVHQYDRVPQWHKIVNARYDVK